MTVLIHVLGSDIPHHNRTVLRFFDDALAATGEHAREFMVVGKDDGLSDSCPALYVQIFPGEKIAGGSGHRESKANRQQHFLPRSVGSHTLAGSAEWWHSAQPVFLAYLGGRPV
ncbi:TDP-N-acetylfucosamine:lipid II N-acetylfucosaminyltransferase [Shigella flexneri]